MRRHFLRHLSLLPSLTLTAGATSTVSRAALAQPASALRIGIMPFVPYSALLLARQYGWIEAQLKALGHADTQVTWVPFAGGPPINEAFASGDIDIAALGDTPALVGHASGIANRLVGLAYKGGGAQALLVRADAPYRSVKALRGKKVATLRGGNVHELLVLILAEAGLKLSDVSFINLGAQDLGTALLKGDIEAALAWDPLFTRLESEGSARILRDGQGLKNNLNPIVASAAVLKENPDFVRAYLRAAERGALALRSQPEASAKVLAPIFGLTNEQTLRAFSRSIWQPPVDAEVRAELTRSVDFLRENRLLRNKLDIEHFIDLSSAL